MDNGDRRNLTRQSERVLGRGQVGEIQRVRMLAAMVEEVAERGVAKVTVAHVVARSGVSRRTFYEIFEDREDCFLAAFDDSLARVAGMVVPVFERPGRWRERVRAGLVVLLSVFEREPDTARVLVVESLGGGSRVLEARARVLGRLVGVVEEGRGEARHGAEPASLTAEGMVGGVLSILHSRLLDGSRGGFLELTNPLMGMIVLPYLGAAAARSELERALPSVSDGSPRGVSDPLREVHMRLTYRTLRVLAAVASDPGSSNRTIADRAGVSDQGQISKLLTRLHGLGLVENIGAGPVRGERNAWRLTDRGREVHGAILRSTTHA